jgi:hypothetical protein
LIVNGTLVGLSLGYQALHRRNPLVELNLVHVFTASRTLCIIGDINLQCASSPAATHKKP